MRQGLGAQQVVVTDPMHRIREMEVSSSRQGFRLVPLATFLFLKESDVADKSTLPSKRVLKDLVRRYALDSTLGESGFGALRAHLSDADGSTVDGDVKWRAPLLTHYMPDIEQRLGGSIKKAAKVASKATVLLAPLIDPDNAIHNELRRIDVASHDGMRWSGSPRHQVARAALGFVADRQLVVDRGHQDVAAITADLRDMAELTVTSLTSETAKLLTCYFGPTAPLNRRIEDLSYPKMTHSTCVSS